MPYVPNGSNAWYANNLHHATYRLVSTLDYKQMIIELENKWSDIKYKYHITIGSLGSKMQHLRTFFFLTLHQEIGLWYAEPNKFDAKRFSKGEGSMWQIPFGSTKKIWNLLKRYMTYHWEL